MTISPELTIRLIAVGSAASVPVPGLFTELVQVAGTMQIGWDDAWSRETKNGALFRAMIDVYGGLGATTRADWTVDWIGFEESREQDGVWVREEAGLGFQFIHGREVEGPYWIGIRDPD